MPIHHTRFSAHEARAAVFFAAFFTAFFAMFLSALLVAPAALAQQRSDVKDGEPVRLRAETLTRSSETVVLARAVRSESFWNDDRTAILTRVTLRVDETLMGAPSAETDIIIPGGRIGNVIHDVSDMPVFEPGDEAIVFVERHANGMNIVNGGSQGKLDVVTDRITREKRVLGAEGLFRDADAAAPATPGAPGAAPIAAGAARGAETTGGGAAAEGASRTITLEAFKRALQDATPRR